MVDAKHLEARLHTAKRFLNAEVSNLRGNNGQACFTLSEVGFLQDTIHETVRRGLRNLTEQEFIKIQRILTSVEARMLISKN